MLDSNTILLSGYAKLPTNITAEAVYNTLVIVVLADRNSGVILDAEASVVTELSRRFIADMLRGYDLHNGPEELIAQLEQRYLGNARKALETALRTIFVKYRDYTEAHVPER